MRSEGSNPTGPTELSVQILSKCEDKNKRQTDFLKPNDKNLRACKIIGAMDGNSFATKHAKFLSLMG